MVRRKDILKEIKSCYTVLRRICDKIAHIEDVVTDMSDDAHTKNENKVDSEPQKTWMRSVKQALDWNNEKITRLEEENSKLKEENFELKNNIECATLLNQKLLYERNDLLTIMHKGECSCDKEKLYTIYEVLDAIEHNGYTMRLYKFIDWLYDNDYIESNYKPTAFSVNNGLMPEYTSPKLMFTQKGLDHFVALFTK